MTISLGVKRLVTVASVSESSYQQKPGANTASFMQVGAKHDVKVCSPTGRIWLQLYETTGTLSRTTEEGLTSVAGV